MSVDVDSTVQESVSDPHPGVASAPRLAAGENGMLSRRVVRTMLPPTAAVIAVLVGWELYVRMAAVSPTVLPAPSRVAAAAWRQREALVENLWPTLTETALGLALAIAAAWTIAAVCDLARPIRRAIEPLLVMSQTVPIVAIAPLFVMWFGFALLPKVLVVALTTFFPIAVGLLQGMASTPAEATRLLRSMGATSIQRFFHLRVPTALPAFFTGLRVSVVYAVIGAIFGEYVGAQKGLGIFMQLAKNARQTDALLAAVAVTSALSLALYVLVVLIERLTLPWYRLISRDEER